MGGGAVSRAPEVLRSLGCQRPLVVTDAFMRTSGLLERLTDSIEREGMDYGVFDGVVPDPTTDCVEAGLAASHECGADAVLGFGGGSSIDTAKAIAVLAKHGGPMAKFKAPAQAPVGLPVVAVPTTAGTGSEVTRFAVITDTGRDEKMLCMGPGMLPVAALVDHQLTHACPYRLTMDSGLDALCHALEAYVSRKANAHADAYALEALRAIPANLRAVNADLADTVAREALMAASTHAGIAFSNASVTLIHGMSRPIGARFHIAHGLSNAILLPRVTEYSLQGAPRRYAEAARAMGAARAGDSDVSACDRLLQMLQDLTTELRVPSLSALGVSREAFVASAELMAEQALASGSPANNPTVPTPEDVVDLYGRVYT